MAPVSVATSTSTVAPSSSRACASPSASTMRPSASVLNTSVVRPPTCRTTSEGRYDEPDTAFSAAGTTAVTAVGNPSRAAASTTARTAAPPASGGRVAPADPRGGGRRPPPAAQHPAEPAGAQVVRLEHRDGDVVQPG